jgi:hypothetical protein
MNLGKWRETPYKECFPAYCPPRPVTGIAFLYVNTLCGGKNKYPWSVFNTELNPSTILFGGEIGVQTAITIVLK